VLNALGSPPLKRWSYMDSYTDLHHDLHLKMWSKGDAILERCRWVVQYSSMSQLRHTGRRYHSFLRVVVNVVDHF
jgi:hypothetical protein